MAEPIEMSFGLWTRVDPRNHVLDVGPDSPKRRDNVWGKDMLVHVRRQSAVSCAKKMAEPTNKPFGLCGLWVQGIMCYVGCTLAPPGEYA